MVNNNCVVQGCVVGTAKQNVTMRDFPKKRAIRQLWRRFVSRRLEATGSGRVTPMCAVHTSFLLTLLTMSDTMGFAKTRIISMTAAPIIIPLKFELSQRSLNQSLDAMG